MLTFRALFAFLALALIASSAPAQLIINEVDYDNVGTDTAEFVEIYNTSACPVRLTGKTLVFVNGASNTVYLTMDLGLAVDAAGVSVTHLAPGQYLVVGDLPIPASALRVHMPILTPINVIQNGSPDGIAIVDTPPLPASPTIIDSISYEGAITAAIIPGFSDPVNLVNGTMLPAGVADNNTVNISLGRFPSGLDSNDDATDWQINAFPTPGAPNVDALGNISPIVPPPPPPPPRFCCPVDYNLDGVVNVPDIFVFLSSWFAGDPQADFNQTGGIGISDIFDFLAAWFLGC